MAIRSFLDWLQREVPDATQLALAIARAGAAGVSHNDLRRITRIHPDALRDLLAALTAAGQITVLIRNGQRVYRAVT